MYNIKKILCVITVISVIGASCLSLNAFSAGKVKYGDCNNDGSVNIADLVCAANVASDNQNEGTVSAAVDYNRDGSIGDVDINKLRRVLLEIDTYDDMVPNGTAEWRTDW